MVNLTGAALPQLQSPFVRLPDGISPAFLTLVPTNLIALSKGLNVCAPPFPKFICGNLNLNVITFEGGPLGSNHILKVQPP